MRTQVVLVDFENVQPDLLPALKAEHVHVRIFVGPLQQKLPTDLVLAVQELGGRAKFVRVAKQGKESLDLHLAYYMGSLSRDFEGAYFHVVSKDQGFVPLVEHLNTTGPNARLVESLSHLVPSGVAAIAQMPTDLSERVVHARRWIASRVLNRPATRKTLFSSLEKSAFLRQLSAPEIERVMEQLIAAGVVRFDGERASYSESVDV